MTELRDSELRDLGYVTELRDSELRDSELRDSELERELEKPMQISMIYIILQRNKPEASDTS